MFFIHAICLAAIVPALYVTANPTPIPTVTTALCPKAPSPSASLKVAPGFQGATVVGGLSNPRHITLDRRGNILVVERGIGITGHFVDTNGCVTRSKVVIEDAELNHGIDLNKAGNKLLGTSREFAWSWDYDPVTMTARNRRTLVTGMTTEKQLTRTIVASKVNPNFVAISVSAGDGPDYESFDPAVGRAQVRAFDITKLPPGGAAYNSSHGVLLGYGLSNAVGVVEDRAGYFHVGDNGAAAYRFIDNVMVPLGEDNPSETFFKLSNPKSPRNLFAGYPYCFNVWDSKTVTDRRFELGDWSATFPEGEKNDQWCAEVMHKLSLILPPHSAPLDLVFGPNDSKLYVAVHGNGFIDPTKGFSVVSIDGKHGPEGWAVTGSSLNTTFTEILANDVSSEDQCLRGGCFRPLGLAWNEDGNKLYVTSDNTGEIILLKKVATQGLWGQW
ncbi:hypothetical protein FA15DRAFT_678483 [Coprinopsis marcescibilis]|uniref:Pyrroloquinoline quinone-dependent pyranose dehydrogenase beta-propeller domain-containing protein n=1 Tax=Coprinopsis marcescibilis TaxID=230819 RepID=A0A5C3L680_COPMA|nr:hypothetical protein FA15DRAFT_678483 [Coprinopsis marcescibilis]